MNRELIQIIKIILYRLEKSVEKSGENYLSFQSGKDSRTPYEILKHLVDVSNYGLSVLNASKPSHSENSILEKINGNFTAMIFYLSANKVDADTTKELINGPLSDALTHIGQLAFLRRLAGNPIAWENYTKANT